jgi:hypothetical protein
VEPEPPGLDRLAELLRGSLTQARVTLPEVDQRLGWKDGTLNGLLTGAAELKVKDLLDVLRAAGIEERAFFAALYELEPRCRPEKGEIPYSAGDPSEEDVPNFPPLEEILSLFRNLVAKGVLRADPLEGLKPDPQARFLGEADLLDGSIPEE